MRRSAASGWERTAACSMRWRQARRFCSGMGGGGPYRTRGEGQFPLGLLPGSSVDGQRLEVALGDLLVVATDGILEVCNKLEEEFGVERLKQVIAANAQEALAELAARILAVARGFGPQSDDQTILILRCL